MKLYLWWWYNADLWGLAVQTMQHCIETIFAKTSTKQVLHVPFARTWIRESNRWSFLPPRFAPYLQSLWVEYLNAEYVEDIERFQWDTIYINGWNDTEFLMSVLQSDLLQNALASASVIIGESAGAMVCWSYFRRNKGDGRMVWLWYVPDTIIVAHFSERNWLEKAQNGMKTMNIKSWLWIDECTFVYYEDGHYWEPIGQWSAHLL